MRPRFGKDTRISGSAPKKAFDEKLMRELVSVWRSQFGNKKPHQETGRGMMLDEIELEETSRALLELQRGLTGERTLASERYMHESAILGAYLLYYWPVSYLQVSRALESIGRTTGRSVFETALDIGSGPGPAARALSDRGTTRFTLVDSGESALRTAQSLLPENSETRIANIEKTDPADFGKNYDIAVASHVVNELFRGENDPVAKRADFLERCAECLSESGIVLVVEPALLSTSRDAIFLRDEMTRRGFGIVAPCRFAGECPLVHSGDSRTCHDAFEWELPEPVGAIAKRANLNREAIKMTWFAFARRGDAALKKGTEPEPLIHPESEDRIIEGTVVSDPMLNKGGRVRYVLCTENGLVTVSAKNGDEGARSKGFFGLSRFDDIIIRNPEIRETGFGIGKDTEIRYTG